MGAPNPLRASPVSLDTSLGEGVLVFRSMTGQERLGQPFVYRLEVSSRSYTGTGADLIGQPITVHFEYEGAVRHFSAVIADVEQGSGVGSYNNFYLTLRPWFWVLTQVHNSRIFQGQSIPNIVKTVLREHAISDFEDQLFETYPEREMVVQYCESDFNFISRLLEEEGIYYFFRHEQAKHTVVFADSQSSHDSEPDTQELPYYPPDGHRERRERFVDSWAPAQRFRPDTFSNRSYDFKHPKADLGATRVKSAENAITGLEVYEYPSPHLVKAHGEDYARRRLEELQANLRTVAFGSNAPNLLVGRTFKLTDHPTDAENSEYLVLGADFTLREPELESGGAEDGPTYHCEFEAMPHTTPFRPRRLTPKPFMRGPQTARVVTSGSEDLTTDEFGRIHVKFHWDRLAKDDETASAWVRVAQMWAGAGWGGQFIPRVNMEVVVIFLEGDPDQPLVTGCVYNGDNAPPYAANTQSGVKSRSTKGGTAENFNEIRFEDKKGSEELHVQAEKDLTSLIKHDRSVTIGHNDTLSITGDQFIHVHGNLSMTVDGVTDKDNPDKGKPIKSSMAVTGAHDMKASDSISLSAPNKITLTVGGSSITITPGSITIAAGGGASISLGSAINAAAAGKGQMTIDDKVHATTPGGSDLQLDAKIHLKSGGGADILMDPNIQAKSSTGSQVLIDASAVLLDAKTVKGTGTVDASIVSGPASMKCSAAGAEVNSPMTNVKGGTMVNITGAIVKIN